MKTKFYFLLATLVLSFVFFNAMGQKKLLFVGGADPADPEDQHIFDTIAGWGYEMTYYEDGAFVADFTTAAAFDAYDAVVISESVSSNNAAPMQTVDFSKPCLNFEGYALRTPTPKWSWVPWEEGVNEVFWFTEKTPVVEGLIAVIVDNTHYITEDYNLNDEIVYSTEAAPTGEQVAFDLSTHIPDAIQLATSKAPSHAGKFTLAVIPQGTMVPGSITDVPAERMVIFATHKANLAPEVTTDGFRAIVKKSITWILGEEPQVAVHNIKSGFSGVKLLNNPVRNDGIISFNLKESGMVSFSVLNLIGQQVMLRSNESFSAGQNELSFSTSGLNEGIYIYQLKVNNSVFSGKMHILK